MSVIFSDDENICVRHFTSAKKLVLLVTGMLALFIKVRLELAKPNR